MFDQDAPHQLSRNGKKMGAILPLHAPVIHQAHVGLINQGRRLKAVAGPLASDVALGKAVEFVIDDGGQLVERGAVSAAPGTEQAAYLTARWRFSLVIARLYWIAHSPAAGIIAA